MQNYFIYSFFIYYWCKQNARFSRLWMWSEWKVHAWFSSYTSRDLRSALSLAAVTEWGVTWTDVMLRVSFSRLLEQADWFGAHVELASRQTVTLHRGKTANGRRCLVTPAYLRNLWTLFDGDCLSRLTWNWLLTYRVRMLQSDGQGMLGMMFNKNSQLSAAQKPQGT